MFRAVSRLPRKLAWSLIHLLPEPYAFRVAHSLRRALHPTQRGYIEGVRHTILHASEDAWFHCLLNGERLDLPRATVRTMLHCLDFSPRWPITLHVEDNHLAWLRSHLQPGGVFLDVGSATGAMALPLARAHQGRVRIIAFEPARTARRLLHEAAQRNRIDNIEIIPAAVSDRPGTAEFAEYRHAGEDDTCHYRPEASALHSNLIDPRLATFYPVDVLTLDTFAQGRDDLHPVQAMKIDVEGFEVHVLDGALAFLDQHRPALTIDIHRDPFGPGTTEAAVRQRLARLGYRCENFHHVLLCHPTPEKTNA